MDPTIIYLVTFASLIAGLAVWNVYRFLGVAARRSLRDLLRKLLVHKLLYHRRKSTDSINLLSLGSIFVYVGANAALCTVGMTDRNTLSTRCGSLFLINMIPLMIGGRLSLFADRLASVQPWNQSLAHRWIGRVCLLEGALHGILKMLVRPATVVEITVSSFAPTLALFLLIM